ncbi:GNAT family N-acetyltransferase [Streptomyces sp. NPDC088788]|uniref:GNAT family N-acetyltransferase n=1 Tax=Streptomyces sp. NPDC088788 TaxID=3365898 RepID=UPI00381909AF
MNADMQPGRTRSDVGVRAQTGPGGRGVGWTLRPAVAADVEVLAELRATVMRADLERLGRYDGHRVRQRLRDSFSTEHTSVITVDGDVMGCVTVRPAEGAQWLEHFYLAPRHQGRGLGSAVLRTVVRRAEAQGATLRLNVLQGSSARRLYERHGFVVDSEDPIDVFMVRSPGAGTSGRV